MHYLVVATEDNTQVDVYYSTTDPDQRVTLNQFQVYTETINDDLTGTRIVASKPVSVYCGGYTYVSAVSNN